MTKKSLTSTIFYSVLAGTLASLASVCAKLAVDSSSNWFYRFLCHMYVSNKEWCDVEDNVYIKGDETWIKFQKLFNIVRIISFLCIFLCNTLMWGYFTKALSLSVSTIQVTIINTCANFFLTAILGRVLFNEPLSLQWWFGASLIITGTVILNHEIQCEEEKKKRKTQ